MIILGANETRMPKPVTVDLAKLIKTSSLVDPKKFQGKSDAKVKPLPSVGLIEQEIRVQAVAKASSKLMETGLAINGSGTEVVNASGEKVKFDRSMVATENRTGEGGADMRTKGAGQNNAQQTAAVRSDVIKTQIIRGNSGNGNGNIGAQLAQAISAGGKVKSNNGNVNGNNGSNGSNGNGNGNNGNENGNSGNSGNSGNGNGKKNK
jgi:hypothetical protein